MSDLGELRRQRDELTREIEQREKELTRKFINDLHNLEQNLMTWARDHTVVYADRTRKNSTIIELNGGKVTIEFDYPQAGYNPGLSVRTQAGLGVDFTGGLPNSVAFLSLVEGLLEAS